jgi:hypothetical protein
MYEVPPDPPPQAEPLQRAVSIVLVAGLLVLSQAFGFVLALIVVTPLATLWHFHGHRLAARRIYAASSAGRPRTIFDPATWAIIMALLGLLAIAMAYTGH